MRMISSLRLVFMSAALAGCTSYLPSGKFPLPPMAQQSVKVVTIPLPVIASSPNEGITYGALSAFLLHNEKDEITTLVAPQVNQNRNFGTTATVYGAFYPSPERSFEANVAQSTKVNYDYELKVRDQTFMDKRLELNAFLFAFRDGSARFFGFQSTSKRERETNYADGEVGATLSAGYPVLPHTQVVLGERVKQVEIDRGAVTKVPFLRDVQMFKYIPGGQGFTVNAQMLSLVYSTLDSATIPTRGLRAKASVEASVGALGSSADYRHYDTEVKGFYPLLDARFISVGRLAYSQTMGERVPFLERSTLGG